MKIISSNIVKNINPRIINKLCSDILNQRRKNSNYNDETYNDIHYKYNWEEWTKNIKDFSKWDSISFYEWLEKKDKLISFYLEIKKLL